MLKKIIKVLLNTKIVNKKIDKYIEEQTPVEFAIKFNRERG